MQIHGHDFAALIGLDWADRKHDICLLEDEAEKPEFFVIDHDPAALEAWADELRRRFDGRPVAVCLELARGPIVSALLEHDFFGIPLRSASGRELDGGCDAGCAGIHKRNGLCVFERERPIATMAVTAVEFGLERDLELDRLWRTRHATYGVCP